MNDHESFLFNLPDTPQLIHQFNDIESFLLYLNDLVLDQENHQLLVINIFFNQYNIY